MNSLTTKRCARLLAEQTVTSILTTQRGNEENGVSLVMTKTQESGNHTDKEERIAYTRQKGKLSANALASSCFHSERECRHSLCRRSES
ncbi:hypothetical protein NXW60_03375 [Bacteroides fragilis]|nr:hypothetical protein NXW60_03375 [Bacteroides fragilis]